MQDKIAQVGVDASQYEIVDGRLAGVPLGRWPRPEGRRGQLSAAEREAEAAWYKEQEAAIRDLLAERDGAGLVADGLRGELRTERRINAELRQKATAVDSVEAYYKDAERRRRQAEKLHARGLGILQELARRSGLRLRKLRSELEYDFSVDLRTTMGGAKVTLTVYADGTGEITIQDKAGRTEFQFNHRKPTGPQYESIATLLQAAAATRRDKVRQQHTKKVRQLG